MIHPVARLFHADWSLVPDRSDVILRDFILMVDNILDLSLRLSFDSSTFRNASGKFTKAKQLLCSKPMSRRLRWSLARSAFAQQAMVGDESETNVDTSRTCAAAVNIPDGSVIDPDEPLS